MEKIISIGKRTLFYTLSLLIAFEAYSIYNLDFPWNSAKKLNARISYGTKELAKDFPLRMLAYQKFALSKINNISSNDLSDLLEDKKLKKNIFIQIKKDRNIKYSEVGGVVTFSDNGKNNYLEFREIKSDNMRLCSKLISAKGDTQKLVKLADENNDLYRILNQDKRLWDYIHSKLGDSERFGWFLDKTINIILSNSDSHYYLKNDSRIGIFYPGYVSGKIIAFYHIHDNGEPPASADLQGSRDFREFVISSPDNKEFTLYDLVNGRINAEITKNF